MNDPDRQKLSALLGDPVLAAAFATARKRSIPKDIKVAVSADVALALALQHSYLAGANDILSFIEGLAKSKDNYTPPPLVEWGTLTDPDERQSTSNGPDSAHTGNTASKTRRTRKA